MPTTQPHAPAPHPPTQNVALAPPAQNVAPPPSAQDTPRRGLTLRGCFISVVLLIFLIIAAVFVVPAVIMILKEEQAQPSINDPRIR
jgi:magnesium-transporting ATPase (P-type)